LQTCFNLRRDGQLFRARTWGGALKMWFGRNGLAGHLLRPGLDYFSPSFHPWRHDNRHPIESWLDHNSSAWRPVRPKAA
jgi:predicted metal-dependent hydrolase